MGEGVVGLESPLTSDQNTLGFLNALEVYVNLNFHIQKVDIDR